MENLILKPKDKIKVMIFGILTEVIVYSFDSKYVYFIDPGLSNIPDQKHKLFSRKIGLDKILTLDNKEIYDRN